MCGGRPHTVGSPRDGLLEHQACGRIRIDPRRLDRQQQRALGRAVLREQVARLGRKPPGLCAAQLALCGLLLPARLRRVAVGALFLSHRCRGVVAGLALLPPSHTAEPARRRRRDQRQECQRAERRHNRLCAADLALALLVAPLRAALAERQGLRLVEDAVAVPAQSLGLGQTHAAEQVVVVPLLAAPLLERQQEALALAQPLALPLDRLAQARPAPQQRLVDHVHGLDRALRPAVLLGLAVGPQQPRGRQVGHQLLPRGTAAGDLGAGAPPAGLALLVVGRDSHQIEQHRQHGLLLGRRARLLLETVVVAEGEHRLGAAVDGGGQPAVGGQAQAAAAPQILQRDLEQRQVGCVLRRVVRQPLDQRRLQALAGVAHLHRPLDRIRKLVRAHRAHHHFALLVGLEARVGRQLRQEVAAHGRHNPQRAPVLRSQVQQCVQCPPRLVRLGLAPQLLELVDQQQQRGGRRVGGVRQQPGERGGRGAAGPVEDARLHRLALGLQQGFQPREQAGARQRGLAAAAGPDQEQQAVAVLGGQPPHQRLDDALAASENVAIGGGEGPQPQVGVRQPGDAVGLLLGDGLIVDAGRADALDAVAHPERGNPPVGAVAHHAPGQRHRPVDPPVLAQRLEAGRQECGQRLAADAPLHRQHRRHPRPHQLWPERGQGVAAAVARALAAAQDHEPGFVGQGRDPGEHLRPGDGRGLACVVFQVETGVARIAGAPVGQHKQQIAAGVQLRQQRGNGPALAAAQQRQLAAVEQRARLRQLQRWVQGRQAVVGQVGRGGDQRDRPQRPGGALAGRPPVGAGQRAREQHQRAGRKRLAGCVGVGQALPAQRVQLRRIRGDRQAQAQRCGAPGRHRAGLREGRAEWLAGEQHLAEGGTIGIGLERQAAQPRLVEGGGGRRGERGDGGIAVRQRDAQIDSVALAGRGGEGEVEIDGARRLLGRRAAGRVGHRFFRFRQGILCGECRTERGKCQAKAFIPSPLPPAQHGRVRPCCAGGPSAAFSISPVTLALLPPASPPARPGARRAAARRRSGRSRGRR